MDRRIIASTTSAGGGYIKTQESISLLSLHELFSSRLNPVDPASGTSAGGLGPLPGLGNG